MSPEELRLPQASSDAFAVDPSVARMLRWQWRVDPPPWIIKAFPDDLIRRIYAASLEHQARAAEFEVKLRQAEAELCQNVARMMGK